MQRYSVLLSAASACAPLPTGFVVFLSSSRSLLASFFFLLLITVVHLGTATCRPHRGRRHVCPPASVSVMTFLVSSFLFFFW
jgi:hypothetical protein